MSGGGLPMDSPFLDNMPLNTSSTSTLVVTQLSINVLELFQCMQTAALDQLVGSQSGRYDVQRKILQVSLKKFLQCGLQNTLGGRDNMALETPFSTPVYLLLLSPSTTISLEYTCTSCPITKQSLHLQLGTLGRAFHVSVRTLRRL